MDQRFILHELKDINNDYESKHIAQELCKHAFGGINIEAWESSCSEDRRKLDSSTELEGFGRWECQNISIGLPGGTNLNQDPIIHCMALDHLKISIIAIA